MTTIELAGKICEVDEHGFLQEPAKWDENVARAFAEKDGINNLTDDHWKVMNYIRGYYTANKICPMIKRLMTETGFSLKQLYDLFPEGPANSACKWAGMPKPTGCS